MFLVATTERLGELSVLRLLACHATGSRAGPCQEAVIASRTAAVSSVAPHRRRIITGRPTDASLVFNVLANSHARMTPQRPRSAYTMLILGASPNSAREKHMLSACNAISNVPPSIQLKAFSFTNCLGLVTTGKNTSDRIPAVPNITGRNA